MDLTFFELGACHMQIFFFYIYDITRCVVPVKDLEGKVVDTEDQDEITEFSIPAELKQLSVK